MKGQFSLEMVVGLIILLVVAGVVISLVLFYVNPKRMPSPTEQLSIQEFKSKCESLCSDTTTNDYCTYYYPGEDWDKDGIKYNITKVGKYEWPTCEDRVYCFLVVPCEDRFGIGINAIEKCRQVLCQAYIEKFNDVKLANASLWDNINFSTKCSIMGKVIPSDNWYERVFSKGCVLT
jgi:hypothetical protein